jgi:hypothetical protein
MVRRIFSVFVLIVMLFNISGYFFTFYLIQQEYKKQFRKYICQHVSPENSELIIISDAEIQRPGSAFKSMEENEFRYQGKMYDIIKSEKRGNNNIFYCVNDKNEEQLLARFEDYLKHHDDTNAPYQEKSNRIFFQIIKQAITEYANIFLFPKDISNNNFCYFFSVQTVIINNIFIPPKVS